MNYYSSSGIQCDAINVLVMCRKSSSDDDCDVVYVIVQHFIITKHYT